MARFPALPLFCDSWVLDTKHLTRSERGTYHDLLVLMWTTPHCRVPNERRWIEERLGYPAGDQELDRVIREFCKSDGNWIWQKRLRKEFRYLEDKGRKRSAAAKARWDKEKDSCALQKEGVDHPKHGVGSVPRKPRKSKGVFDATPPHPTPPNDSTPFKPPKGGGKNGINRHGRRKAQSRRNGLLAAYEERERERKQRGGGQQGGAGDPQ